MISAFVLVSVVVCGAEEPRGLSTGGGLGLLLSPEVRAELKLSDAQSEKILNVPRGMAPPGDRAEEKKAREELYRKREQELKQILDEKQQGRLWELILQKNGGRAIEWPNVADKLKLDAAQMDRIKKIREDTTAKPTPLSALSREEQEKVLDESRKRREKRKVELLTVLTAEQKELFEKMQGVKFTFPEPRRP